MVYMDLFLKVTLKIVVPTHAHTYYNTTPTQVSPLTNE